MLPKRLPAVFAPPNSAPRVFILNLQERQGHYWYFVVASGVESGPQRPAVPGRTLNHGLEFDSNGETSEPVAMESVSFSAFRFLALW